MRTALSYLPDNAVAEVEDDEVERYAVVRVAERHLHTVQLWKGYCQQFLGRYDFPGGWGA